MHIARAACAPDRAGWPRLIGDIGGTNARFGWLEKPGAPLSETYVMACAELQGIAQGLRHYLAKQVLPTPESAVLAVASPVSGDSVAMTNLAWRFSIEELRVELGLQRLMVLNDFTALALAIPQLPASSFIALGPSNFNALGPIGVLGVGTGLGVSGLLRAPGFPGRWVPIMGEGGHVTLAAETELEFSVIKYFRQRYGHVSAERVLSGAGLVDLHHFLNREFDKVEPTLNSAADVLALGLQQERGAASLALELFCAWLGSVAGNLALTLGALGGIYIGGGIAPRMREFLPRSAFRQRFVGKGRFERYLAAIPSWLIDTPVLPTLEGAALALEWEYAS